MICALALIVAIDVSGSISQDNFFLQRDATAAALSTPGIIRTLEPDRPVAVSVITWGNSPHVSVPWRLVSNEEEMQALSAEIRRMGRNGYGATNMARAISHSLNHLESAPCDPERSVIDVSGDGRASDADPDALRDEAERRGIQINGLPIVTPEEPLVAEYYRTRVITRDGFLIEANGWEDYARAVRRKLVLEIARIEE